MSQSVDPAHASVPAGDVRAAEDPPANIDFSAFPWVATWVTLLSLAAIINTLLIYSVHGTGVPRSFLLPCLASLICLLAGVMDAWTQRIPNQLTYTAFLIGLALSALSPLLGKFAAPALITWLGTPGWREGLMGVLVCAVVPFVMLPVVRLVFGQDALNVGDIKLLAAVGALLGISNACAVLIFALGISVIYSVINLAVLGMLNVAVHRGAHQVLEILYFRKLVSPLPGNAVARKLHIPMAIPLALGVIVLTYWQWHNGTNGGIW